MLQVYRVVLFSLILTSSKYIEGYRILGVFTLNSKSHNVMFDALMRGLTKHNHQVDMITRFPPKDPSKSKTLIDLSETQKILMDGHTIDEAQTLNWRNIGYMGNEDCKLLGMEKLQNFLKNWQQDSPYDVIITEVS